MKSVSGRALAVAACPAPQNGSNTLVVNLASLCLPGGSMHGNTDGPDSSMGACFSGSFDSQPTATSPAGHIDFLGVSPSLTACDSTGINAIDEPAEPVISAPTCPQVVGSNTFFIESEMHDLISTSGNTSCAPFAASCPLPTSSSDGFTVDSSVAADASGSSDSSSTLAGSQPLILPGAHFGSGAESNDMVICDSVVNIGDDLKELCDLIDELGVTSNLSQSGARDRLVPPSTFLDRILPKLRCFTFNYSSITFSGVFWNTHGACGDLVFSYPEIAALKSRGLQRALTSALACFLQETRADAIEAACLSDAWAHSHISWHSFGDNRNAGGVATFLKKSWINEALRAFSTPIDIGRVLLTCVIFKDMVYLLFNIHNSPDWSTGYRTTVFKRIFDFSLPLPFACSILAGDLNFSESSFKLSDDNSGQLFKSDVHRTLHTLFDTHVREFIEIVQDSPTFMRSLYLSCIDRVFIRVPTAVLFDLKPAAHTCWNFGDPLGKASDHVPVFVEIGCISGTRVRTIPSWVCKHTTFASTCDRLYSEVRFIPSDPLAMLLKHKDVLTEAAWQVKRSAVNSTDNLSIDQQIYFSLVALRHAGDPHSSVFREAQRSYPYISSFLNINGTLTCLDVERLGTHISTLHYNKSCRILMNGPSASESTESFKRRSDSLNRWISLWASKRHSIANIQISRPDGTVCSDVSQSALALSSYWAPVFTEKDINKGTAILAIAPFVTTCPSDIDDFLGFEDFCKLIDSRVDSGVGVDACPYSLWANAPLVAKRALFDAYLYLGSPSFDSEALLDFLASRTVFILKGELPTDSRGNFVRPPGKTRPLTLSNTDMKNISSAAACTLGKIATSCISDVQLGGVRGRQMIDHIIRMESRLLEFIARKLPRAGIIALDQAAAFPSISRRFLFWVLRRMRIPKGLYRLLVNLHKPTRTFVCLRNLLLDFFEVSGGVKQGDPAAMVLFVIAFDPLIKFVSSCLSIERCYCFGYCDDLGIASDFFGFEDFCKLIDGRVD